MLLPAVIAPKHRCSASAIFQARPFAVCIIERPNQLIIRCYWPISVWELIQGVQITNLITSLLEIWVAHAVLIRWIKQRIPFWASTTWSLTFFKCSNTVVASWSWSNFEADVIWFSLNDTPACFGRRIILWVVSTYAENPIEMESCSDIIARR